MHYTNLVISAWMGAQGFTHGSSPYAFIHILIFARASSSGVRQDHRTAPRPDGSKGWCFFSEDEDEFGLDPLLNRIMSIGQDNQES